MRSHIAMLLDRSGSMADCVSDTIGGVNTFLRKQSALPGVTSVTIAQFDDQFDYVFHGRLQDVPPLTDQNYVPRGSTALVDAACRLIDEVGKGFDAMLPIDRPEKVFFVIVTDGYENASTTHKVTDLTERIRRQEQTYAWEFIFIGADVDAIAEAGKLGISAAAALNYNKHSKAAVQNMYAAVSQNVGAVRGGFASSVAFTDLQRSSTMVTDDEKEGA
jgi:hypothetical protein